jgi:hypothetical protein
MAGEEKESPDEFKGHDVVPVVPPGFVTWRCERCKEVAAERDWFKRYECRGQPEAVGGG